MESTPLVSIAVCTVGCCSVQCGAVEGNKALWLDGNRMALGVYYLLREEGIFKHFLQLPNRGTKILWTVSGERASLKDSFHI